MKTAGKRPSVRKLFVERMKREGKGKEWNTVIKQVMENTGKRYGQAIWEAMQDGIHRARKGTSTSCGVAGERAEVQAPRQIDEERRQITEELTTENFERALRTLPNKAPVSVEIDWLCLIQQWPAGRVRRTRLRTS